MVPLRRKKNKRKKRQRRAKVVRKHPRNESAIFFVDYLHKHL